MRRHNHLFHLILLLRQSLTAGTLLRSQEPSKDRDLIIGGRPSDGYPWFAVSVDTASVCGASLIHEDVLLTAAHCDSAFTKGGEAYIGSVDDRQGGSKSKVESIHPHPFFDRDMLSYDFMLVKLKKPVTDVPLMEINTNTSFPEATEPLIAMGFGQVTETGQTSPILREADLATMDTDICANVYALSKALGFSTFEIMPHAMMCGWNDQGTVGTCFGDSGGPVVTADRKLQVGIVSFGLGCARQGTPSVFARVSTVSGWIEQTVCEISSQPGCQCDDSCPTPAPTASPTTALPTQTPAVAPTVTSAPVEFVADESPTLKHSEAPVGDDTTDTPNSEFPDEAPSSEASNSREIWIMFSTLSLLLLLGSD